MTHILANEVKTHTKIMKFEYFMQKNNINIQMVSKEKRTISVVYKANRKFFSSLFTIGEQEGSKKDHVIISLGV